MFKILVLLTSVSLAATSAFAGNTEILDEVPVAVVDDIPVASSSDVATVDSPATVIVDTPAPIEIPDENASEAELKEYRESIDLIEQETTDKSDFTIYNYKGEGSLAISKAKFSSLSAAKNFCASLSGFKLINQSESFFMLFALGAPFTDLRQSYEVVDSIIPERNADFPTDENDELDYYTILSSGYVFWSELEAERYDEDVLEKTYKDYPFVKSGDYIHTILNDSFGTIHDIPYKNLTKLNEDLAKVGKSTIATQAICFEQSLRDSLKN